MELTVRWSTQAGTGIYLDQKSYRNGSTVEVLPLATVVAQRHQFTCVRCKLRSQPTDEYPTGMLQITPKDNNYRNLDRSNWILVCEFCNAPLNLLSAIDSKRYVFIRSKDITQKEISYVCHAILTYQTDKSLQPVMATELYNKLYMNAALLKMTVPEMAGSKSGEEEALNSVASFFRNMCYLLRPQDDKAHLLFSDVRILPRLDYFVDQGRYFYDKIFSNLDEKFI